LNINHDSAKHKRAEEELRFQAQLLDSVRESVVATDLEGHVIYWSKGAETLYGYRAEEVMRKLITFIVEPPEAEEEEQRMQAVRTAGSWNGQYVQRRKDGSKFWADTFISLVTDENGQPCGLIGIDRDITERKQAEEGLHRYERIVSASSDFMSVIDRNYIYQAINASYLKAFGKTQEEIVGHHVAEVLGEEAFKTSVKPNMDRCLAGEHVNYQYWLDFTKWGPRYLDVHYDPFRDTDGSISGVVVVVRDITHSKRAEDELRRSRERLRNLAARLHAVREEERAVIAREIHDELGQALTGLQMDLSWLTDRLPKNRNPVIERARSMRALLDSALDAVRQLSSRLRPALLDDLGLEAAIEWQAQEFTRRTGCKCGVHFMVDELRAHGDRDTVVFRVLQEALTNVTRHADARHVEINLRATNGQLELDVKDDGKGITEGKMASTESLGLIGMHERARALSGQVHIQPLATGGTLVRLRIPLVTKEHNDSSTHRR